MKPTHRIRTMWLLSCLVGFSGFDYAHAAPATEKPRYTMPSGKGWSVCEAYLKYLNALPANDETLTCDLKLNQVPGMREPDWQEMDIARNLDIVHQIEVLLGIGHIDPDPDKDFVRWKRQREVRMKTNGEQPRLRRARLPLVAGGEVETVLSYNVDIQMCEKELKIAKTGQPYSRRPGDPNFFILDEAKRSVKGSGYWTTVARGELVTFLGKPYYVDLDFSNYNWDSGGHVFIKRLEPVLPAPMRLYDLPNDPLYDSHELCRIRFDYPFPRLNPPYLSR